MNKYAIIQNGLVINYVEYETQPDNPPPSFEEGTIAVLSNNAGIGYTYENGTFIAPPVVISPEMQAIQEFQQSQEVARDSALAKLAALGLSQDELKALIR